LVDAALARHLAENQIVSGVTAQASSDRAIVLVLTTLGLSLPATLRRVRSMFWLIIFASVFGPHHSADKHLHHRGPSCELGWRRADQRRALVMFSFA
jgi:hypothetical protein